MPAKEVMLESEYEMILNLRRLPARLTVNQVAVILGFHVHEITVLMHLRLLEPLGEPAPNGHKFFAAVYILKLAEDCKWLNKATKAVSNHWKNKNARRAKDLSGPSHSPNAAIPPDSTETAAE